MFCGFDVFYALVWFPVQYVMMMRSRLDRHISRSPSDSHEFSTVYLIIVAKSRLPMTSTTAYMYLHLAAFTPGSETKFQNLYKRLYIITIIKSKCILPGLKQYIQKKYLYVWKAITGDFNFQSCHFIFSKINQSASSTLDWVLNNQSDFVWVL